MIYAVYDTIARKPVTVFQAANLPDALRYTRSAFTGATSEQVDGLALFRLGDFTAGTEKVDGEDAQVNVSFVRDFDQVALLASLLPLQSALKVSVSDEVGRALAPLANQFGDMSRDIKRLFEFAKRKRWKI